MSDLNYTETTVARYEFPGLDIELAITHHEPEQPERNDFVDEEDYDEAMEEYDEAPRGYTYAFDDIGGDWMHPGEPDGFYPQDTAYKALLSGINHIVEHHDLPSAMADELLSVCTVITTGEAETLYNLPANTISRDIHRGKIQTARKSGGVWLVSRTEIERRYSKTQMKFPRRRLEIVFPIDMLWQEADADDYNADATEQAYDDAVMRALYRAGYEADITYSTVSSMEITDGNEEPVTDDRYEEIRTIIDGVPVDYIEMDDDNE